MGCASGGVSGMDRPIRTRLSIVPGASLHIEAARIALFNWLIARQGRGEFLLRIDDGDTPSETPEGTIQTLDDLRWLGLDWDGGPGTERLDGPPQSCDRSEKYGQYYKQLIDQGHAYWTYDSPRELERMRSQALAQWRPFRYPRPARLPTEEDVQRPRRQGLPVVLRLRMPGRDIAVDDAVLGPVTLPAEELDDFVIRREDGRATWLFAETIDDALMQVTHVVRGQERLPYAHRQVALQEALGLAAPIYAHLPLVLGTDGRACPARSTCRPCGRKAICLRRS